MFQVFYTQLLILEGIGVGVASLSMAAIEQMMIFLHLPTRRST